MSTLLHLRAPTAAPELARRLADHGIWPMWQIPDGLPVDTLAGILRSCGVHAVPHRTRRNELIAGPARTGADLEGKTT
jgi:hypothetical protein